MITSFLKVVSYVNLIIVIVHLEKGADWPEIIWGGLIAGCIMTMDYYQTKR